LDHIEVSESAECSNFTVRNTTEDAMLEGSKRNGNHADRRDFIAGSDARVIMGQDEKALIRLWQEKRGEVEPEDLSANLIVQLGLVTEDLDYQWGTVLRCVHARALAYFRLLARSFRTSSPTFSPFSEINSTPASSNAPRAARCAFCLRLLPIVNGELQPWPNASGQFFCNEFRADDAEEARFQSHHRRANRGPDDFHASASP
jgi:hypothetical protein